MIVDRRCELRVINMGGRVRVKKKAENHTMNPGKFYCLRVNY